MENICFYDENNLLIMEMKNLCRIRDSVIDRVSFDIEVRYDIFKVSTNIEAETSDFFLLEKRLVRIYALKTDKVIFLSIDEYLIIVFSYIEGKVDVNLKIRNTLYNATLSIQYKTNLTFLNDLINNLHNIESFSI